MQSCPHSCPIRFQPTCTASQKQAPQGSVWDQSKPLKQGCHVERIIRILFHIPDDRSKSSLLQRQKHESECHEVPNEPYSFSTWTSTIGPPAL
eukprot:3233236-Amphidinium_carterae.1